MTNDTKNIIDSKLDEMHQEHQFISPGIKAILEGIKNGRQIGKELIDLLENDNYRFSANLSLIAEFDDEIFGNIGANTTVAVIRILQGKYREDKEGANRTQILELVLRIAKYATGSRNMEEAGKILNWFSAENKESEAVTEKIREALRTVDPSFTPPPQMAPSKTAS